MAGPDWLHFPPLTALRAFEATARLQSFSAAARALNVTHAAVAQQVRGLEDRLGVELVYRDGRALALTPEGARLAAALNEGFRTIEGGLSDVQATKPGAPLRVTMTPGFAALWLMPRLGEFWAEHPDITLSLHPDRKITDLRRDGFDLAIRFGRGNWPGIEAEHLICSKNLIVASPALLRGRTPTHAEMTAMPWVMIKDWPEDVAALKALGFDPSALSITYFPTGELALSAARQGYGLHIESAPLVEQDIRTGQMIALDALTDEGLAYYLVTRPGPRRPELKTFIRWLKSKV
ncbi:MAG TPA: LysR family transcriptional regulator [Paracoccaceae bacterium]